MEKLETTVGKAIAETTAEGKAVLKKAVADGGTAAAKDTAVARGTNFVSANITTRGFTVGAQRTPANILTGGAVVSGITAAAGYAAGQHKNNEKETQEHTDEFDSN